MIQIKEHKLSFETNETGRVICSSHSNYSNIHEFRKLNSNNRKFPKSLKCQACSRFTNNLCYFSLQTIQKIYLRTEKIGKYFRRGYRCKACNARIDNPYSVLYKKYLEGQGNIEIPLLCCDCYTALDSDWINSSFNLRVVGYFILLICGMLPLIPIGHALLFFEKHNFLQFFIPLLSLFYFIIFIGFILKKIRHLFGGKQYLKQVL